MGSLKLTVQFFFPNKDSLLCIALLNRQYKDEFIADLVIPNNRVSQSKT